MSLDLEAAIHGLAANLKELASDVSLAELLHAVRRDNGPGVSSWGSQCRTQIDCRLAAHCLGGLFALSAPPIWLAAYKGDLPTVLALLRAGADPDCVARPCACEGRRSCSIGGQSALHIAVSRGSQGCVKRLLDLNADPHALMCFPVRSEDEPEWNEATDSFEGGLVGLSAVQVGALGCATDTAICAALLEYGGDGSKLSLLPGGLSASLVRPVTDEEGTPVECAICLSQIPKLTAHWTPCCCRAFHSHCVRGLTKCPLCRTSLPTSHEDGGAVADRARGVVDQASGRGASFQEMLMRSTANENREAALALSFRSSHFEAAGTHAGDDMDVRVHDRAGSQFGWRMDGGSGVGGEFRMYNP